MPITINDCKICGKLPKVIADYNNWGDDGIEPFFVIRCCTQRTEESAILENIAKEWNEAHGGNNEQTDEQI
jgi:hypothetical protein